MIDFFKVNFVCMYSFSSKITHKTSSQQDNKARRQLPATKNVSNKY